MRFLLVLLVAILSACGSPGDKTEAKKSKTQKSATKSPAKPRPKKPSWPPEDIRVDAGAFSDLDQGVAAISVDDAKKQEQAVLWLATQQGAAAVGPLREIALDESASETARHYACMALGYIADPAVAALIDALGSATQRVRLNAAKYLGLIRPKDQDLWRQSIGALVKAVDHDDEPTRIAALNALKMVGLPAKNIAEAKLQSILDDNRQSDAVRSAAGAAIKEVAPRRKFGD